MNDKRSEMHSTRARRPNRGRADLEYLDAMTEEEIMANSPPELTDLPDDFWDDAVLVSPKQAISIRVDHDVLEWFRSVGPGYQTRMNAVLRHYMEKIQTK